MTGIGKTRRYPIRCIDCGAKEVRPVTIRKEVAKNHDGRNYNLVIDELPVTQCQSCNSVFFTDQTDSRIDAALRTHLRLLTPEQIRANLAALSLSQKEAAEKLGIAPETLSRWLNGAMIQSRAMDNLLRMFFACPEAREKLLGQQSDAQLGVTVQL